MNRKQRRKVASVSRKAEQAGADSRLAASEKPTAAPLVAPNVNPSLFLRAVAFVVLSRWVRNRVRHPAVRSALAVIARDVGRTDLASELDVK